MGSLHFRSAADADLDDLLRDLRPADRDEAEALLGAGRVEWAVRESLRQSLMAWTAEDAQGAVFIFGLVVASLLDGTGGPWMLGTTRTEAYPRELVRQARPYIARMLAVCPLLANYVDARNTRAIAWLKRIGFTVLPAEAMGAAGLPFHPFYLEA